MKKFLSIILSSLLLLTLASCLPDDYKNVNDTPEENLPAPATYEELYSLYNAIERDMTRADVEALFGEGKPSYDDFGDLKFLTYFNETKSAGVSLVYSADGVVTTKTLYFNTKKNLIPFSGRFDRAKIPDIKDDISVVSASEVMGSLPLELSCQYLSDGPQSMNKIYCWYNEDASSFMIHTESDLVKNVALYIE